MAQETPPRPIRLFGRNARIGLVLFVIYVAFYAGFIVLTAFFPLVLRDRPYLGLNGAILYGFGLIIVAFAMAMIYMALCRAAED